MELLPRTHFLESKREAASSSTLAWEALMTSYSSIACLSVRTGGNELSKAVSSSPARGGRTPPPRLSSSVSGTETSLISTGARRRSRDYWPSSLSDASEGSSSLATLSSTLSLLVGRSATGPWLALDTSARGALDWETSDRRTN